MNTKIFIFFVLAVLTAVLLTPVTVQASQTTRTLQPNRTYEFIGNDSRVVSHVNVSTAGRFEIVEINAQDELQSFGFSSRRFSVIGSGRTSVTPSTSMTVTFDASRLRLYESQGSVLRQIQLYQGQTVHLRNNSMTSLHIRTNQPSPYEFVIIDRLGDIYKFGFDFRFPQLSIMGGATAVITASDSPLTIYFPRAWYGDTLTVSRVSHPALATYSLTSGQVFFMTNHSNESLTLTADTVNSDLIFQYEFIIRGRDGHVIDHGTVRNNQISLGAHQSIQLTPLMNANLYFPHPWRESISILNEASAPAPAYRTIAPGASLTVENNDPFRPHTIFIRCEADSGLYSFDYLMQYDNDISFNVFENVTESQTTLVLPSGASMTITATGGYRALALSIPEIPEISSNSSIATALTRHVLEPGQSIYISNSSANALYLLATANGNDVRLDYVRYYIRTGVLDTFGRMDIQDFQHNFSLSNGQSVLITSPDYLVTLHLPQLLLDNGLTFESRDTAALYHHVLSYGDVLQIDNVNRQYNHSFLVHDISSRANRRNQQNDYSYEFVHSDSRGVLDYGMTGFGHHVVPARSVVSLMPREGVELSVAFPTAWYGRYFQLSEGEEAPLHRITLPPGRSVTLNNRSRMNFAIANNSRNAGAGFLLRGPGEYVRVYHEVVLNHGEMISPGQFFPPEWSLLFDFSQLPPVPAPPQIGVQHRYEYVPSRRIRLNSDIPEQGNIYLPTNTRLTVTAALGTDLEIWMPTTWARVLGLI